jgi:ribosomal protein S18 acetylase RimI-like enzyme
MLPSTFEGWRAARPEDDARVVRLGLALYEEDPSPDPVGSDHFERTLAAFRDAPWRGAALVLELGGEIVGYALLVSFWSNELGGEVCDIDELYVAPEARGRGHDSKLLDALAAGSTLWPGRAVALALEVTPDNRRARALYERLGFAGKNVGLRRPIAR